MERSQMVKLREFKVSGGLTGDAGKIEEFIKICSQMQKGRLLGYTEEEVRIGIIESFKAESALRKYFDGKVQTTQEKFMKMLKSWYQVRESFTFMTMMEDKAQEPTQTEAQYLIGMMNLRDTILILTADEECPLAEKLVRKRFLNSLLLGFKVDTIRLDLQHTLKDPYLEDDEMTREVLEAVTRDKAARNKNRGKGASCNRLSGEDADVSKMNDENIVAALFDKFDKIDKKVSSVSASVNKISLWQEQIQKRLDKDDAKEDSDAAGNNRGGGDRRRTDRYRFIKCEDCEAKGLYCTHCSICGQSGHKRNACPTKNE